jgi:hypothetical protein
MRATIARFVPAVFDFNVLEKRKTWITVSRAGDNGSLLRHLSQSVDRNV